MPEKTEYYNYKTCTGELAEGCKQCVLGQKLVVFVTGVCGNGCNYCPVSDAKNHHDVIFANEAVVKSDDDLIKEANMMNAKGAGITGGDPLAVMPRTLSYIRLLKTTFGPKFHIHLYTPLLRVTEEVLDDLYAAGLDEIRFHPKLDDSMEWHKLEWAKEFDWSVGVEIPALPEYEKGIEKLFKYLADNVQPNFINLNEFEYADNQVFEDSGKSYEAKNELSYGVKGSDDTALRLLELGEQLGLAIHYCTAKSKDAVQLATRLKRRSEQAARSYDAVDEEGLLTRGAIYGPLSIADANYTEKLSELSTIARKVILEQLKEWVSVMVNEWDVPEELVAIDEERLRILTTTSVAEHASQHLNTTVALVKEYPTADAFIVEAEILSGT